ncbi:Uracil DNA glycosylase superfamily protein [Gemmata obscuriglobus]|uniref:Type-4 uracil-DNA glycosylase n=1 Tax=Gemmata obscuriglobus TaxID=114 RepID=A0A2Z3H1C2_9BACT|nr:uracil-DNA glycosylase [Gemmata obscuriglobus]AWM39538.1 uracil-DNA glycosylase [Gemmata obscuriglobus]QEG27370.1 Uracil DNA glycosylase superfamily protein [Gemmata obscuriglobus]VTS04255.1 DNA polymerase, bacteriophage-type OS=Blastopirellula marina DSM 3645 GN=DSM3645_10402 PE=4 SV=1: UDG [Gemmata obscuriglobus UQM 2246]
MSDGPIDLVQQLRAHLHSLGAAGVLFAPRGEPLVIARPAPRAEVVPAEEVAPAEDPLETRRRALATLAAEVSNCDKCSELFSTRLRAVFGTGPLDPEVAFVGEAPGYEEDAQGEPFVGKGGQLLRRIIAACQLPSAQEYLLNIIKCRPPRTRPPTMAECGNCRDIFRRQFELVRPKYLVALGLTASRLLSGKVSATALGALRGQVHQYRGVPLICTHHPNDIDADGTGRLKRETWDDMKLLLRTMGRDVPAAK